MLIVPTGYNLFLTALLAPIFLTIAHGNNYLGILGKPTAFLGTISYSVYLLHGIVLYVCTHLASRFVSYGNLYSLRYWMFIAGTGTLVIVAATLSYRYIEYPWMAKPAKTTL
jgi:peptidoglycan/LPS O-acetylase OafA/YrhL